MSALRRWPTPLLALSAAAGLATAAHADVIVTACGTQDAPGGMNLASAAHIGGHIAIHCVTGGNEIRFTHNVLLNGPTTIDGEGKVTLTGPGEGAMFLHFWGPSGTPVAAQPFVLKNLTVRNPRTPGSAPAAWFTVMLDRAAQVELDHVTVRDTPAPFVVRRFVARDSMITKNGEVGHPNLAAVSALELDLAGVTFNGNHGRPIYGWRPNVAGAYPPVQSVIADSAFLGNARPSYWARGRLMVRNSRFEANGGPGAFADDPMERLWIGLHIGSINTDLDPGAPGAGAAGVDPSVGGALELVGGRVVILKSSFRSNHGVLGGAVFARQVALSVKGSDFVGNHALRGGALAFASTDPQGSAGPAPQVELNQSKFSANVADWDGGAIAVVGPMVGDAALFSGNFAGSSGGAVAAMTPDLFRAGLSTEVLPLLPRGSGSPTNDLMLSRGFFVDNRANHGAGLSLGAVSGRLANSILARNIAPQGGTIEAQGLALMNVTFKANQGVGLALLPGSASIVLANVVIDRSSGGNCAGSLARLSVVAPSLQNPGGSCGPGIAQRDPMLGPRFEPLPFSPARSSGGLAVCLGNPLVRGGDAYGRARGPATCSIGAVEANLPRDLSEGPFGWITDRNRSCWLLGFIAALLVAIVIGARRGYLRRRRRDEHSRPNPENVG